MSLLRYVSPRGLFLQSCPLRILVQRQSSNRVGFFGIKKARARDIAPGSIKARDKADYDRITGANKDNRNLRGCRLGCRCRWSVRRDYRDFTAYKIGGHYLEAIILTPCPCRKLKREHIGGVVRPKVALELRGLRFGRHAGWAHLSAAIGACEPRCSTFDMN